MKSSWGRQGIVCPGLPGTEEFPRIWNLKPKIRMSYENQSMSLTCTVVRYRRRAGTEHRPGQTFSKEALRPRQVAQMSVLPMFPFSPHVCLKPEPQWQSAVANQDGL